MEAKKKLSIWGRFFSRNIQSKMSYKADFLMGILANFSMQLLGFVTIWTVFRQVDTLMGWSYYEVLFMYGLAAIPNGISEFFFDGIWRIGGKYIGKGELDRLLTRPIDPLLSIVMAHIEPHGLGLIIFGIAIISISGPNCSVVWSPLLVIYTLVCSISGSLIFFSINLSMATLAFFVVKVKEAMVLVHHLNSFTRYPISIYHRVIQATLTFLVPFAFTAYYPAAFILKKSGTLIYGLMSPIVGFVLLLIAYSFWKWGLKHYQSTGG